MACLYPVRMLVRTAGLILLSWSPLRASTTTINFDDLPVGTSLANQYAGVTFTNVLIGNGDVYFPARSGSQVGFATELGPAGGSMSPSLIRSRVSRPTSPTKILLRLLPSMPQESRSLPANPNTTTIWDASFYRFLINAFNPIPERTHVFK